MSHYIFHGTEFCLFLFCCGLNPQIGTGFVCFPLCCRPNPRIESVYTHIFCGSVTGSGCRTNTLKTPAEISGGSRSYQDQIEVDLSRARIYVLLFDMLFNFASPPTVCLTSFSCFLNHSRIFLTIRCVAVFKIIFKYNFVCFHQIKRFCSFLITSLIPTPSPWSSRIL